jgi:hypothetical protein
MVMRWLQDPSVQAVLHAVAFACGVVIGVHGSFLGVLMATFALVSLVADFLLYRRRRALRRESLQDVDLTS